MSDHNPTNKYTQKVRPDNYAQQRHLEREAYQEACRNVIHQLDAIKPDMEQLKAGLAVMMERRDTGGFYERDALTHLSVIDALEANKHREAAKECVDYVAKELQRATRHENNEYRRLVTQSKPLFTGRD